MKNDFPLGSIMFSVILLLFMGTSNAKPIDYEDVANLLPTEPQTINDTLAAIVRDSVVQDAVQNSVGNGSLEGLVVKKNVVVLPAVEPTKVMLQREQVLVVPMTNLEDVQKNITETVNAETDVNGLTFTNIQSFESDEDGYTNSEDPASYTQSNDFYEPLTETMRKSTFPTDNIPQEIPYLMPNPSREMVLPEHPPPAISVPIIAFLDPAKIPTDKINTPIVTTLTKRDDLENQLKNERDEIQRNVQNYVDENTPVIDPENLLLTFSPSEMEVSSSLYEPGTVENQYVNDVNPENLLPVAMPLDIVTPLFWTSDVDVNYPKNSHDMDVAADIVFRPLFRYRQEAQQRSYRRSAHRRYNSYYNSYPRRRYRYRPRYSDDYY